MKDKQKRQWMANGIILACSTFISDTAVSSDNVCNVLGNADITKEEWDKCKDEYSKQQILEKLDGRMKWID